MPSVTDKGKVTIPESLRETMGIKPGDKVVFEETTDGYVLKKEAPMTEKGTDPFKKYRGIADSGAITSERMHRLRGEYPREIGDDADETNGEQ